MDRREFAQALLVGAGALAVGFSGDAVARAAALSYRALVMIDAATGRVLHRSGAHAQRFTPCSTFKLPLALMGFDAGILRDVDSPAWDYVEARDHASRAIDKQRTDPTSWEANSVLWYSQELTRKLGMARFRAYIDRFGYGNRDVRGNPGKNDGLTESWLMSSLEISPDEQVAFLRRVLGHTLASADAHAKTEAVVPVFAGSGGWSVHGKTGSGWLKDAKGRVDRTAPLGWFVGWADRGGRRVVFARFGAGHDMPKDNAGGPAMRAAMLAEIGRLAG